MHRRLILITGFMVFFGNILMHAQVSPSFLNIDTTTYNAYLRHDWKTVIKAGRQGIRNDIDYYFLRMRMGIACHEKTNYRRAILHFNKAREFNNDGESINEYLYHAYNLSGRTADARFLSASLTPSELEKNNLTHNNKVYGGVYFQYLFNQDAVTNVNYTRPADPLMDGIQIVVNHMSKMYGAFDFEIGRRLNLYLAYTFLVQDRFYYQQESGISTMVNKHQLFQNQIYLGNRWRIGNGWNMTVAYHYALGTTPNYYRSIAGPGSGRVLVLPSWQFHDHLFHLALTKDISYINFGVEANVARIQGYKLFQGGLTSVFYPLGNLNLYAVNNFHYLTVFQSGIANTNKTLFESNLGWKVASFLWMELYGSWGDHSKFSVVSGRLIYNGPNRITQQYGGSVIFPFARTYGRFFVNYYFVRSESQFVSDTFINSRFNTLKIESHTIRGGLSWTF